MAEKMGIIILMVCGITLLFYFGGLVNPSDNALLALLISPGDIKTSVIYSNVANLVIGGIAGITVGWLTKDLVTSVLSGVVGYLWQFFFNIIQVFNIVYAENVFIALVFFAPFIVYMFYTIFIEVWAGR